MKFIIARNGSNSANQHMCQRAIVGVIEAKDYAEAESYAYEVFHCYNNQHLEINQGSKASRADKREAQGLEVLNVEDDNAALDAVYAN